MTSLWTDESLFELFDEIARACARAVDQMTDRREPGLRVGQYGLDLRADAAALQLLDRPGLGVLSEESGLTRPGEPIVVVIDPIDGSTNASRRVPWYATSLCAVDAAGARLSLVRNLVTGVTFTAVRGGGAFRDGQPISPSNVTSLSDAVVLLSGLPPERLGWRQSRTLGAAALDMCAVASGDFDAFIDCSVDAHGVWDYAGAELICREAGASVCDAHGRELLVRDPDARRTPVASATAALHDVVIPARLRFS
jgi:myo-inositol-1(or 4)-monophosphatase